MVWGHNKEREVSILAPTVEAYNRISLILFKFLNNRSASSRQFSVCRRTQVLSRSHSYNEAAIAVLGRAGSTRTTSTARTFDFREKNKISGWIKILSSILKAA